MTFRPKRAVYMRLRDRAHEEMVSHQRLLEQAVEEFLAREARGRRTGTGR